MVVKNNKMKFKEQTILINSKIYNFFEYFVVNRFSLIIIHLAI